MTWSDCSSLRVLPNPSKLGYEIKHETGEVTFLGQDRKPDFAEVIILLYPKECIIELRSLKEYFYQFRDKVISYERLINVVYDDLMAVCKPDRLRLVMRMKTRGGFVSTLKIDSDWSCRGGAEKYKDWVGKEE